MDLFCVDAHDSMHFGNLVRQGNRPWMRLHFMGNLLIDMRMDISRRMPKLRYSSQDTSSAYLKVRYEAKSFISSQNLRHAAIRWAYGPVVCMIYMYMMYAMYARAVSRRLRDSILMLFGEGGSPRRGILWQYFGYVRVLPAENYMSLLYRVQSYI
jgi:hypothetical protein